MRDDQVTIDPEFRPPPPDGDQGRWLRTLGVAAVVVAAFAFGWLMRTPEQIEPDPEDSYAAASTTTTVAAEETESSTTRPSTTTTTEPPAEVDLGVPLNEAVPGFSGIITIEQYDETGVDVLRWRSTQSAPETVASFVDDQGWWFNGLDASGTWYALRGEIGVLSVHRVDGEDAELPWFPDLQAVGVRVNSLAWHDTAPGQLAWLTCSRALEGPGTLFRLDVADGLAEPQAVRSVDRVCTDDGGAWLEGWGEWGFSLGVADADRHQTVVFDVEGSEIGRVGDSTLDTWLQAAGPLGTIWTQDGPNTHRSLFLSPDGETSGPVPGLAQGEWLDDARWSGDGTRLTLAVHSAEDDSPTIRIVEMPSGSTLAEFSEPIWETDLGAWSPDGRFLVYTGWRCLDDCDWSYPEEWALGFYDTATATNTAIPLPTSPEGGWVGIARISDANTPATLVEHYTLDGDAAEVRDHAGGGLVIGATPTSDRFGAPASAYAFDGKDDRIVMETTSIPLNDTVSIAAWVKIDDDAAPRPVGEQWDIVSYGGRGHVLAIQGAGAVLGGLQGTGADCEFMGSDTVLDDDWHHVAFTRDANWVIRVYLDGDVQALSPHTLDPDPHVAGTTATCLTAPRGFGDSKWIGSDPGLRNFFNGSIDDVRIYSGVLTDDEVAALAANIP